MIELVLLSAGVWLLQCAMLGVVIFFGVRFASNYLARRVAFEIGRTLRGDPQDDVRYRTKT